MKNQSSERQRRHHEYFRNLSRFAGWLKRWRQSTEAEEVIMRQVLEGESVARARAWGAKR